MYYVDVESVVAKIRSEESGTVLYGGAGVLGAGSESERHSQLRPTAGNDASPSLSLLPQSCYLS
jgi:hypothetical protein